MSGPAELARAIADGDTGTIDAALGATPELGAALREGRTWLMHAARTGGPRSTRRPSSGTWTRCDGSSTTEPTPPSRPGAREGRRSARRSSRAGRGPPSRSSSAGSGPGTSGSSPVSTTSRVSRAASTRAAPSRRGRIPMPARDPEGRGPGDPGDRGRDARRARDLKRPQVRPDRSSMKRATPTRSLALAIALASLASCGDDDGRSSPGDPPGSATLRITFTSTWSPESHPTEFPPGAHFSPLVAVDARGGRRLLAARRDRDRRHRGHGRGPAARASWSGRSTRRSRRGGPTHARRDPASSRRARNR